MSVNRRQNHESVRELLHIALSDPGAIVAMDAADLDLTIRVARRVRVLGNLAVLLQDAGLLDSVDEAARDQFQSALVLAESRASLALWELDRIAWAMSDHEDVRCIVMKGCAYLLLDLPNAGGRIFADVDLMLPESALAGVEEFLNHQGWESRTITAYDQNYYRNWTHELPPIVHVEREVEIDLHHNILPRTARLKPDAEKLLQGAREVAGSKYFVLADEDIVLHAMTHLMFNDEMADKLRDLVDIRGLCEHFSSSDPEFWSRLVSRAEEQDLRRAMFYSLRYMAKLPGTPVPDDVVDAASRWGPPSPVVWLMDRLVPRALYPPHPDYPSRLIEISRWMLYVRSHWIRMPPWLLVYHLSYKFLVKRFSLSRPRHP
jgi:hypothetical protein